MWLMAQVTAYVSPYMLVYDEKILHFCKVFALMVQFSMLLLFHNLRMSSMYYKKHALLHYVSLTCGSMQMYQDQMDTPSSLNWVLHSFTTWCQFDLWKNANVPR